jgi:DNA (cytosine-5)-methyltransferase 1
MNIKKSNKYTFIDLFAGIGGFHLAFHKLGLRCVFASEIDESARESYKKNFEKISPDLFNDNRFNSDIYNMDKSNIPDFDILCAGFPCQPFSQIGQKKGFSENFEGRGNLFFEIADILKIKKPRAFFLENVQHLINHDNGNTFKVIKETIEKLNFSFYHKVIRASDFNLPQHRPRTFMVGFHNEIQSKKMFNFPEPIKLKKTMSHIFEAECSRDIGFTLRLGGGDSGIDDRRNWDRYYVNGVNTKIQPLQGKRMQGFPDNFFLANSRTKSMKLLGNSVAVNAVYHVGKNILDYLSNKEEFYVKSTFGLNKLPK